MRLLSVNVGLPRELAWNGKIIRTSIFKEPVTGRVRVARLNVEGDQQSDLTVHGGPEKAVYAYPSEHYPFWRGELAKMDLAWGVFGENFTTTGLLEETLHIGDRVRIGSAEFVVTQPRMPCYKLGLKFGRTDIIRRFLQSERSGFYFAVLEEGEVGTGDQFELIEQNEQGVKVSDITRLYARDKENVALLQRAIQVEALPESWRSHFQKQLERVNTS